MTFLSSFDDGAVASGQRLKVLREGFAEHGEACLRAELEKHSVKELHGVAAAAGVPRHVHRRRVSGEELLDALLRCVAQKEASWGIDAMDDVSCPG